MPLIIKESNVAPSIQSKYNQLKRARLVDHLNEILAKRPGPLELVESGILVSADAKLNEAIKDGKIVYPRTSGAPLLNKYPYNYQPQQHHQQGVGDSIANAFNLDDSNLNAFNFNFSNLTDNEDSNTSQSSSATAKTVASLSSSSFSSFNFISNSTSFNNINVNNQIQAPSSPSLINANKEFNFGDIFQSSSSNAPSPSSSISTTIAKSSPISSPFSNLDYLNTDQCKTTVTSGGVATSAGTVANSSKSIGLNKKQSKSFSSASSISSVSSSHKSTKSGSNGPGKKFLYFIEYKGPHQKTIKSTIGTSKLGINNSGRGNKSSKLANKSLLKPQIQSNLNQVKSSNSNNMVNTQLGNSNEQFYEDSNDSTNLNSNFNEEDDELNAYEIRLEQQKVFLEYSNACNGEDIKRNGSINQNETSQQCFKDLGAHEQNVLTSHALDNGSVNNNVEMSNVVDNSTVSNQQFNQSYGIKNRIFKCYFRKRK